MDHRDFYSVADSAGCEEPSPIKSAVANRPPTWVIFTFAFCPTCPPLTNITKPSTLAIPSPFLLISVMETSYSFPVSTGLGLSSNRQSPPNRLPPP